MNKRVKKKKVRLEVFKHSDAKELLKHGSQLVRKLTRKAIRLTNQTAVGREVAVCGSVALTHDEIETKTDVPGINEVMKDHILTYNEDLRKQNL